jgi:hypothetical protein
MAGLQITHLDMHCVKADPLVARFYVVSGTDLGAFGISLISMLVPTCNCVLRDVRPGMCEAHQLVAVYTHVLTELQQLDCDQGFFSS